MKKSLTLALISILVLTGCAKKAEEIQPAYISPLQYQHLSCNQLQSEMQRVSARVSEVAGIQDKEHTKDVVATTVGLLIFWPALFLLAGSDKAQELSRLKGEYEALQKAAIDKNCPFYKKNEGEDINETLHSSL